MLGIDGIDDTLAAEIKKYIKEGKSDLEGMSAQAQKIAHDTVPVSHHLIQPKGDRYIIS